MPESVSQPRLVAVDREAIVEAMREDDRTIRPTIQWLIDAPPTHLCIPMDDAEAIARWRKAGGWCSADRSDTGWIEDAAAALDRLTAAWEETQAPPPRTFSDEECLAFYEAMWRPGEWSSKYKIDTARIFLTRLYAAGLVVTPKAEGER